MRGGGDADELMGMSTERESEAETTIFYLHSYARFVVRFAYLSLAYRAYHILATAVLFGVCLPVARATNRRWRSAIRKLSRTRTCICEERR